MVQLQSLASPGAWLRLGEALDKALVSSAAAWVWEMQDTTTKSCAERTLCSCKKVRIRCFNNDIQSMPAVPCTGLLVRLPSSQGAWQLTDLGIGFGTWCTVPTSLSPSADIIWLKVGQEDSSGPWKATSDNTGGKHRLQGHLDSNGGNTSGVSGNSKGSEEITPDSVFVTQANGRVFQHFWRRQQSVFQREANECDLHNQ